MKLFVMTALFFVGSNIAAQTDKSTDGSKKLAILLVAGQSNAVGYDESPVNPKLYQEHPRIKQLGFDGADNMSIIPLTHYAQSYQNLTPYFNRENPTGIVGTKGIQYPLAKRLLQEATSNDYEILVITCAYGGTGFTTEAPLGTYDTTTKKPSAGALKWGVASAYYLAMRERVKWALELNDQNIFLGCIWIQGEADDNNPEEHRVAFEAMTTDFFNFMNAHHLGARTVKGTFDRDCWYNVESTRYWKNHNQYRSILTNYKNWNEKTYVAIPDDTDTNAVNGAGINKRTSSVWDAHFGNDSYYKIVSKLVAEKMLENGVMIP